MMKLRFAVFAERASVDRYSNRLDIQNVIEQMGVPPFPAGLLERAKKEKKLLGLPLTMTLVVHWRRADPRRPEPLQRTRVELLSPKGKVVAKGEQEVVLRDHVYSRSLFFYQGLPFDGPGTYSARISVRSGSRWRKAGEASFELIVVPRPPIATLVRPKKLH